MSAHAASKEIVQLIALKENDTLIEHKRLRNGDVLFRSAIGESLTLRNGAQISIRSGYFSLAAAGEVTIERCKTGTTTLVFNNGDELKFNDEGIQSLRRGLLLFQFSRKEQGAIDEILDGQLDSASRMPFNATANPAVCRF